MSIDLALCILLTFLARDKKKEGQMNPKQKALIAIIAGKLRIRPEDVTPETKLGHLGLEAIAVAFVVKYGVSLQVYDDKNCTAGDLLKQLA